jgi:hypothetical protein
MSTPSLFVGTNFGLLATIVAWVGNLSVWAAILLILLGASLVLLFDWFLGYRDSD